MNSSRAAIIGGAGFIGSDLCRKLLEKGFEVLVYDNFTTGTEANLPSDHNSLLVKKGDINDNGKLLDSLSDFRPAVVYHLAALHYIPYCDAHTRETLRVNVEGTESVLQACQKIEPDKIISASSAAVYKICDKANAETDTLGPYDIYGCSKYFGEKLAARFYAETSIPTTVARIFNTYGPYETNPHVIPRIIEQIQDGNSTITLGDVTPQRDFTFVEDTAAGLMALGEDSGSGFDIFNVAAGIEYSVEEIVSQVAKVLNKNLTINSDPNLKRKIERMHLLGDISKIKKEVGWEPRFSITEGLEKTLNFYLTRIIREL